MNERLLREALTSRCDEGADALSLREDDVRRRNLDRLRPQIGQAALRIQKRREAHRQNMLFLACACAFVLAAVCVFREWAASGAVAKGILLGGSILMGLILALSPLMAYCLEEEREHEKA